MQLTWSCLGAHHFRVPLCIFIYLFIYLFIIVIIIIIYIPQK